MHENELRISKLPLIDFDYQDIARKLKGLKGEAAYDALCEHLFNLGYHANYKHDDPNDSDTVHDEILLSDANAKHVIDILVDLKVLKKSARDWIMKYSDVNDNIIDVDELDELIKKVKSKKRFLHS